MLLVTMLGSLQLYSGRKILRMFSLISSTRIDGIVQVGGRSRVRSRHLVFLCVVVGALHVTNPSVAVSPCCFNFSATGEHSGVVKRYVLSFRLAHDVVPYEEDDQSNWGEFMVINQEVGGSTPDRVVYCPTSYVVRLVDSV